ncbi:MAG: hypothetical protein EBY09_05020 [Verrucomicrobia bacterium]|nr:hypothetical protein [Verrucomicrobiota bacterium]
MPAGAQKPGDGQGPTTVEVKVSGELLDGGETVAPQLLFSHPGITATPVLSGEGKPEKDRFLVTIAADVPPGLHDARMMTALGVSSPRVFTIGTHPEALRTATDRNKNFIAGVDTCQARG